jgi:hypothetical protein
MPHSTPAYHLRGCADTVRIDRCGIVAPSPLLPAADALLQQAAALYQNGGIPAR